MVDHIGKYVKEFESGDRGIFCFGSWGNDWGLSCGTYQMTLRWGNCINFLKLYYPDEARELYYNGMDIATSVYPGKEYSSSPEEVMTVWLVCIGKDGREAFYQNEWQHIKVKYYDNLLKVLQGTYYPDSRGMEECLWSWAVHKGWQGAEIHFREMLREENISDPQSYSREALFDLIYKKRYEINKYDRYEAGNPQSETEKLRPLLYVPVISKGKEYEMIHYINLIRPLKKGDKGENVRLLQLRLARLSEEYENEIRSHSFDGDGVPDGVFGEGMVNTLKKIQSECGLEITGALDEGTIKILSEPPCYFTAQIKDSINSMIDVLKTELDSFRI